MELVIDRLSKTYANGVRAQVERTLTEALRLQSEQVLRQFSLDHKDSALSRLGKPLQEIPRCGPRPQGGDELFDLLLRAPRRALEDLRQVFRIENLA